ncbi:hypothetical protein Tco_1130291, partial [Tanacetum coccineum]
MPFVPSVDRVADINGTFVEEHHRLANCTSQNAIPSVDRVADTDARQSLTCIRLCLRGQSCLHAPSTGCGSDDCAIRTSYRRLDVPYLLRGLTTPYLMRILVAPYILRGLATPYLLRRLAAPYLLRGLATSYLLKRYYSLAIASRPEVAFFTPSIPVNCSNIEWCEFSIGGVSIGGSRGASPLEVHKEHLYRMFMRSASIGGSRWVSPSEVHNEHLYRKFTRSPSIG